jgi:hypothetical protein
VSSCSRRYAYLRRGYRHRLTRNQRLAGSAVAAGLLLAMAHGHTPPAAVTASAIIPSGSAYSPPSWAAALLSAGGWPQTRCNLAAVTAWEQAEGGNWQNGAAYNPLNTTYDGNGTWESKGLVTATINGPGVRAYDSWQAGFTATLATLGNGRYGPILSALSSGGNAQTVADAVAASPWGTSGFQAAC